VVAQEALLRWNHPERGLLYPDAFLALAEEAGLLVHIGDWVLRTACRQACAWQLPGQIEQRVAVNICGQQLQQGGLVSVVRAALGDTGCRPSLLVLEITESAAMQNLERVRSTLGELRETGVGISIDDFGTGYSSLSHLKHLPVDSVKIDKAFVRDLASDEGDAAIVSAVIAMAHSLRLTVVAEGVESPEQLDFLRQRGCDLAQGYLFGRPVPAAPQPGNADRRQASPGAW
jgi:EAL domain-containing protein (putative c-di-GMP-specific phosphodiesterase class I)